MSKQVTKKIWFISRHPGAWAWFEENGNRGRWQVTHRVPHLDPGEVSPGDIVLGTPSGSSSGGDMLSRGRILASIP